MSEDIIINRVLAVVYDRLRAMAALEMGRQPAGHTLQPTALANEVVARLLKCRNRGEWGGEEEILAIACTTMRRVLIDHARSSNSGSRVPRSRRVPLDEALIAFEQSSGSLIELDEALGRLEELDARAAKMVELRFFLGLTVQEAASALGVSKRALEGDWAAARAWLAKELGA